ncbi:MAG: response regulator, partial [Bacteroidota bacterium]
MDAPKILVVDDEPDILEFLQYNLEKEGFRVVTASDGEAGVEMAEKENPDLIVLDIMMPKMDGVEVCRVLRSKPKFTNTIITFLTAR